MKAKSIITLTVIAVICAALVSGTALAYFAGQTTAPTVTTYSNYPNMMGNPPTTITPPTQAAPTQTQTITPPTTPPTQTAPTTEPLTIANAETLAQNYLNQVGNPNLAVKAIQEYTNTFYVQIAEKDTGAGAFELAIDKTTGAVAPMQGPTMMWNTKYGNTGPNGMMSYLTATTYTSGMMGNNSMMTWLRGAPTTTMPLTMTQAAANAQQYLNAKYPETNAGAAATYYGYYTMQVLQNGKVAGMMSVNGSNGEVMYYTWCGTFMQQVLYS